MKKETFIKAIFWIRGACAIQNDMPSGSIEIQYNELKDKFNDAEIIDTARIIALKEDLYGNYPSLKVWIKYCPAMIKRKKTNNAEKAKFIEIISGAIDCDFAFKIDDWRQNIIDMGEHAKNAIKATGMRFANIIEFGKASKANRTQMINMCSKSWDDVEDEEKYTQIAKQRQLCISESK